MDDDGTENVPPQRSEPGIGPGGANAPPHGGQREPDGKDAAQGQDNAAAILALAKAVEESNRRGGTLETRAHRLEAGLLLLTLGVGLITFYQACTERDSLQIQRQQNDIIIRDAKARNAPDIVVTGVRPRSGLIANEVIGLNLTFRNVGTGPAYRIRGRLGMELAKRPEAFITAETVWQEPTSWVFSVDEIRIPFLDVEETAEREVRVKFTDEEVARIKTGGDVAALNLLIGFGRRMPRGRLFDGFSNDCFIYDPANAHNGYACPRSNWKDPIADHHQRKPEP